MPKANALKHRASAFQRGCDARYSGRDLEDCPYPPGPMADDWIAGWNAVNAAMERENRWR